jgi:hypothetical protein
VTEAGTTVYSTAGVKREKKIEAKELLTTRENVDPIESGVKKKV